MLQRRLIDKLTSEKGSGLVLALMVLLVLSVLGASLGVVTIGSLQLGDTNRDTNSAYYIAEAGANMAYEEFRKDVEASYADSTITSDTSFFESIMGKVKNSESPESPYRTYDTDDFEPQFGDTPTAIVSIDLPSSTGIEREYTINSVGEVNGKERTVAKKVSVIWKDKSPAGGTFPIIPAGAIIAKEDIKFEGGTITGDIFLDSEKEIKMTFDWGTTLNGKVYANFENGDKESIFKFPDNYNKKSIIQNTEKISNGIDWDSIEAYKDSVEAYKDSIEVYKDSAKKYVDELELESRGYVDKYTDDINSKSTKQLSIGENDNIPIFKSYKLKRLNLKANHTIDIGNNDVVLRVEEFIKENDGTTTVVGDGTLTILITHKADLSGGPVTFKGKEGAIKIVLAKSYPEKGITMADDTHDYDYQIVAPYSKVTIAGNAQITGNVIADKFTLQGQAGRGVSGDIFANEVSISGSGKVDGNIVAGKVTVSGGNTVVSGGIFANEAGISGSGNVGGNVVAGTVTVSGGRTEVSGNVLADKIEVFGSGKISGSVVSESVHVHEDGSITYQEFAFDDLGTGSGETDNNTDGLFKPGPAIEVDE